MTFLHKWKQRELIDQGIVGECSRRKNHRNRGPGAGRRRRSWRTLEKAGVVEPRAGKECGGWGQ